MILLKGNVLDLQGRVFLACPSMLTGSVEGTDSGGAVCKKVLPYGLMIVVSLDTVRFITAVRVDYGELSILCLKKNGLVNT